MIHMRLILNGMPLVLCLPRDSWMWMVGGSNVVEEGIFVLDIIDHLLE